MIHYFHSARSGKRNLLREIIPVVFASGKISINSRNAVLCIDDGSAGYFGSKKYMLPYFKRFRQFQIEHIERELMIHFVKIVGEHCVSEQKVMA